MKMPKFTLAWLLVIVGAIALIVVAGWTFHDVTASRHLACSAPAGFQGKDERNGLLVRVPPSSTGSAVNTEIVLNGKLCLGYAHDELFSADLKQLADSRSEVDRLTSERATALIARDAARTAARESGLASEVLSQRKKAADDAETALKAVEDRLTSANAAQAAIPKNRELHVAIDGIPVPGVDATIKVQIEPTGTSTDPKGWIWEKLTLRATSDATGDHGGTWRKLLADADQNGSKLVTLSLVEKSDTSYITRATLKGQQLFRVYTPLLFWLGAAGMVALFGGLIAVGWNTPSLRDGDATSSFSLARVQLLWWMFFVVGGFIFVALVTGQYANVLTEGALTLLGISGITAISARSIDKSQAPNPPVFSASNGFLSDILSDGSPSSIALHRVQIVIWNIILGVIFGWTVFTEFSFPVFGTGLLILSGIVNSTYVGFKFPEKK